MQHYQPHITLHWEVILLSWGGNMLCKVESLMMMLYSESLESLSIPSSGGINIILCGSLTDTCTTNFGTNCGTA